MLDRGGQVTLLPLEAPPSDFESPLDVMQRVLSHEQQVTSMFHDLYELAARDNDSTAQAQLQWFITEQVEEEQAANTIVDQLKLIGSQGSALFLLDRELAGRTPKA